MSCRSCVDRHQNVCRSGERPRYTWPQRWLKVGFFWGGVFFTPPSSGPDLVDPHELFVLKTFRDEIFKLFFLFIFLNKIHRGDRLTARCVD